MKGAFGPVNGVDNPYQLSEVGIFNNIKSDPGKSYEKRSKF